MRGIDARHTEMTGSFDAAHIFRAFLKVFKSIQNGRLFNA
jgi:hypothetical protein